MRRLPVLVVAIVLWIFMGLNFGIDFRGGTTIRTESTTAVDVGAMRDEDALLESLHGEAARRYRAQVPALIPDWSRYAVPTLMEIQPRVAWKAVLDAGSLLLALALVQAAHVLQHAGAVATWWRLP